MTDIREPMEQDGGPDTPGSDVLASDLETVYEELRSAHEEVRTQREQIDSLVDANVALTWQHDRMLSILPIAVVVTDEAGVIRSVNAEAAALLHTRAARLLGKPLPVIFVPSQRSELRRAIGEGVGSPTRLGRVDLLHPSPELSAVDVTALPTLGSLERVTWLMLPVGTSSKTQETLPQALASLASLPIAVEGQAEFLRHSAVLVQSGLGSDVVVSISIGPPSVPTALASTGQLAQAVDGAQLRAGEGPCVTAFEERATVVSDDLPADVRWPALGTLLPPEVRSAVAVPLEVGQQLVGALNVYRLGGIPVGELAEAVELAGATIAAGLYELEVRAELERTSADMQKALSSRAVIDQAKGIVMANRGCTADEAFNHLVELSSSQQKKLRVVAQEVVDRTSTPG